MKAEIRYELPLNEPDALAMIQKAREKGHPQLLVVLEPEPAGTQRNEAFVLGQAVVEFTQEMDSDGGFGKHIATELVS
jgi:hypothetical protein